MEATLIEVEGMSGARKRRRFANIAAAQFIEVFVDDTTGAECVRLDYGPVSVCVADAAQVQQVKAFLNARS